MSFNRREFISTTMRAAFFCLVPGSLAAAQNQPSGGARKLSFYNLHTNERLQICYFENGAYCRDGLAKIDHILRDHRSGEIKTIYRPLLDLLFEIRQKIDPAASFHVISGYRSPRTNALLRNRSRGVAGGSLHMQGKAIDIRVPGCPTAKLRKVCMGLQFGGVGYYPKSNFVHVDTGRVRFWQG